jgi:hypothetical protein
MKSKLIAFVKAEGLNQVYLNQPDELETVDAESYLEENYDYVLQLWKSTQTI